MQRLIDLAERGLLPDVVMRAGIRRLLAARLREIAGDDAEVERQRLMAWTDEMRSSPIALATDSANEQHYELPAGFFETVLGPRMKYSSCIWPAGTVDLADAERRMLELTCERAGLRDGMTVLDLGCGWGSLSTWIAQHYRACRIVAVSNSRSQAEHIRERCRIEGIGSIETVTADMNHFQPGRRFDRVLSVEMFEHMRNWPLLFERISTWLEPGGGFFLHVFCHRSSAYPYVDHGAGDWMARHFFTGGMMPSDDLPFHFADHLVVRRHWRVSGLHYSRTLEAWLEAMDRERERLMPVFVRCYGDGASRWFGRWRIFFLACSELFRYRRGDEWWVSHYLLTPHPDA